MEAKITLQQTLLRVLAGMASSPDRALAAEAQEEHARVSAKLAKLKRESLNPTAETGGATREGAALA